MNASLSRTRRLAAVFAVLLGVIASVFAGASSASASATVANTPGLLGTAYERNVAVATLNLINVERAVYHLPPLSMSPQLVSAAQHHNWLMAAYDTMSHQLPGEMGLGQRFDYRRYYWSWAGENVAWNSQMNGGGVLALQNMMYHEVAPNDGHRQNILSRSYVNVGINVYMDWRHGKVWLTTDFGRR